MNYQNKDEWVTIPKYPKYEINQNGDIRNKKTQKILKRIIKPEGYVFNMLRGDDNKTHFVMVHRLVAELFLPNPNNYKIVNHIDENTLNCNIRNLEWVTSKQNANIGNCKKNMSNSRGILVNEYSQDGSYIRTWNSVLAISKYYHVQTSSIQRALNSGSMSCGHFFRRWNGNIDPIDVTNVRIGKSRIDYNKLGDIDPSYLFPAHDYPKTIDEIWQREKEDYVPFPQAKKDMFFLETYITHLEKAIAEQKNNGKV